jgi:hypothetical protein
VRTAVTICIAFTLTACIADAESEDDLTGEEGQADTSPEIPLRFLPGELFVPSAVIRTELRKVFRTEAELEATLQMDNPGIDFSHEWAVFYALGSTNPEFVPEARARIDRVSLSQSGLTLKVTAALEKNGDNCPDRSSRPFILVAIEIPDDPPPYTRFYRADRTRMCSADSYYDGVAFTAEQAAGALRACNQASYTALGTAGITGSQRSIIINGRTWSTLAAVASTLNIGPATMEKLRALGASY